VTGITLSRGVAARPGGASFVRSGHAERPLPRARERSRAINGQFAGLSAHSRHPQLQSVTFAAVS